MMTTQRALPRQKARTQLTLRLLAALVLCLAMLLTTAPGSEAGYRVYPGGTGTDQPRRTVVLTASGAIVGPNTTIYPDQRRTDGTNFGYYTLDFADSASQAASWQFAVPKSYGRTTVGVTIYWLAGVTSGGVVWKVEVDGKPVNAATVFDSVLTAGGGGSSTERFTVNGTANALKTSEFTSAPTSGWAAQEVAVVKVTRLGSDTTTGGTGDDVAGGTVAKLVSVRIEWTAMKESDE